MTHELLIALAGFAVATTATPGPNNLMVMASGANYGYRRTLPHLIGIALGFGVMIVMIGMVLLNVFERLPVLHLLLKIAGAAYMIWLAWKIATAVPAGTAKVDGKPFSFLQAAAFQWVNPKAWMMGITAISTFATTDSILIGALIVGGVFTTVSLPIVSLWALVGVQLRRWLGTAHRLRVFNVTMAALLVASLWPMLRWALRERIPGTCAKAGSPA